jgi:hypothetical protein
MKIRDTFLSLAAVTVRADWDDYATLAAAFAHQNGPRTRRTWARTGAAPWSVDTDRKTQIVFPVRRFVRVAVRDAGVMFGHGTRQPDRVRHGHGLAPYRSTCTSASAG